ncbi:ATP-binding cassette domain-containing protein [Solidesulfovibrio sp.]|uniref:ABC transporter ATP-binding protein n=1 Tax=Solidesulfovibrio sp. TaxID=2910990 RepID=UPI00260BB59E|nr:ATP-binding cassette domain-containing protein [Solidesulfovibrio sp.]
MPEEAAVGLRIRNMWKTRGDKRRRIRITVPEFDVPPGAFVAVLGPNGCGKSTLLDMLGLLLTPDHADEFVLTGGATTNLDALSRRDKRQVRRNFFAYALQGGGLLECLTVRGNIRFAARLGQPAAGQAGHLAELLGLDGVLDAYPARLSGGQRQKASLACALARRPRIILADEPSAALDPPSARTILETFRQLTRENGISLILVTHAPEMVRGSADAAFRFQIAQDSGRGLESALAPCRLP